MHFMTVCLASRLFPLLICLPSGRVHVGKSSRLPWPQSRLSGCEVCRPSWAASHIEMTGAVLSPPSAECAAAFLCLTFQGSFLVKTIRGCGRYGAASASPFWIFAHFSEICVLCDLSTRPRRNPIFFRSFGLPETVAGQCYFSRQIKQWALFPITTREHVGASLKRLTVLFWKQLSCFSFIPPAPLL